MTATPSAPNRAAEGTGEAGAASAGVARHIGIDVPVLLDAPVAIYAVDLTGRVCFWNDAAGELLGWTADEVLGRPAPFVDPQGVESAFEGLERILAGEVFVNKVFSPRHRDGHRLEVVHSTTLLRDEDGRPAAVLVVNRDVTEDLDAARQLEAEEQRWRRLVQRVTDTVTITDAEGRVVQRTAAADGGPDQDVAGHGAGWWGGGDAFELIHPDDLDRAADAWATLASTPGRHVKDTFRTRHADGHVELVELSGVNLLDDPDVEGIVIASRDVTATAQAEALLADEARVLELIAEDRPLDEILQEVVAVTEYHTGGYCGLFLVDEYSGWVSVGAIGSMPEELVGIIEQTPVVPPGAPDGTPGFRLREPAVVTDITTDPRTAAVAAAHLALDVRAGWVHPIVDQRTGELYGVVGVWYREARGPTDAERKVVALACHLAGVAIERDTWQRDLFQQARYDRLTGLPNRLLVLETLDDTMRRARARQEPAAILLIDLDRFKLVNDSRGHQTGDRLLTAFARRLRDVVRGDSFVGHLGGDEFVVVLGPGTSRLEAELLADVVHVVLHEPFDLGDGDQVILTVSTGIAVSERGAETPDVLLQQADAAMYRAKQQGRDRRVVFDEALRTRTVDRLRIDRDLRVALERQELELHYQPELDARTGAIVGAEALLRWHHPERGLTAPDTFIGIAEESGQIVPIGSWVLEEAVRQARAWTDAIPGVEEFHLSLNLSARQLRNRGLVDTVAFVLTRYGWPPSHLTLELTESILIEDQDETLSTLGRLRMLGVRLAIDDFGTGFASLDYLHKLTVDQVKIDRSFVSPIQADGQGSPVAAAILHMADAFGLGTVAEGVETPEQHAGLRALGCELVQGYLFAPPLPADEFAARLADDAGRAGDRGRGGRRAPGPGRRPRPAPPAWPT